MPSRSNDPRKLRILVVEDNFLIAETIREALTECGHEVVGPASNVKRGISLAQDDALDGAVLDINLNDEFSFPIAEALQLQDVPFVFLTGYDDLSVIPAGLRSVRRFTKPFDQVELARTAAAVFVSALDVAGDSEETSSTDQGSS